MEAAACTLRDCPPGPFLFNGHLGFKTEYGAMETVGAVNVPGSEIRWVVGSEPDAYVGASGERFWGGEKSKEEIAALIVHPLDADDLVAAWNRRAAPPANAEGAQWKRLGSALAAYAGGNYSWPPVGGSHPHDGEYMSLHGNDWHLPTIYAALSSPVVRDVAALPQGDSGATWDVIADVEPDAAVWTGIRSKVAAERLAEQYAVETGHHTYINEVPASPTASTEAGALVITRDDFCALAKLVDSLAAYAGRDLPDEFLGLSKRSPLTDRFTVVHRFKATLVHQARAVIDHLRSAALSAPAPSTEALAKAVKLPRGFVEWLKGQAEDASCDIGAFVQEGGGKPSEEMKAHERMLFDALAALTTPTSGGDDGE